jgi:hypothetical protein
VTRTVTLFRLLRHEYGHARRDRIAAHDDDRAIVPRIAMISINLPIVAAFSYPVLDFPPVSLPPSAPSQGDADVVSRS